MRLGCAVSEALILKLHLFETEFYLKRERELGEVGGEGEGEGGGGVGEGENSSTQTQLLIYTIQEAPTPM